MYFQSLKVDRKRRYLLLPDLSDRTINSRELRARTTLSALKDFGELKGDFATPSIYVWARHLPTGKPSSSIFNIVKEVINTQEAVIEVTDTHVGWADQPNLLAMWLDPGEDPDAYISHYLNASRRWLADHYSARKEIYNVLGLNE